MQKKTISQRLERVAAFVPDGAKLLDVGSDHAYLPIYLIQQGRIEKALAGEVVEGPFQSAQKNVAEHGLTEQIEVRLANGLAAFDAEDQIDTIVIAGMGWSLDFRDFGKWQSETCVCFPLDFAAQIGRAHV